MSAAVAQAQTGGVVCTAASNPPLIHAEGVAERIGDIVLECTGTPGTDIVGNFSITLNVNVTNRLAPDNVTLDGPVVSIDDGSVHPAVITVVPRLSGSNRIDFNGVSFRVPNTRRVVVTFRGIRANATQIASSFTVVPVTAFVAFTGTTQVAVTQNIFSVGVPATGLLGTILSSLLCSQIGSPLPDELTLTRLLAAGTSFATARVTEGYASSFHPRETAADNGVRIVLRYANLPAGGRLFVPDAIAGSSATQPTSAGDFGTPVAPGQYTPGGNGSLLLVRVRGTDANGAGGTLLAGAAGPLPFGRFSEVDVAGGAEIAVYEVLDANPSLLESAQISTFLGLPPSGVAINAVVSQELRLGPTSTVGTASTSAPVPRFAATAAAGDCSALGDCNSGLIPRLRVAAPQPLTYEAIQSGANVVRYITIYNDGRGRMDWTASVQYRSGTNWLRPDFTSGANGLQMRVDALPGNLAPGTYEATLTIDAGVAGRQSLPVTLVVRPGGQPPPAQAPRPAVTRVLNAATFAEGAFVRGSLATIMGSFAGNQRGATFDNVPAQLLYQDAKQLNVLIPVQLGPRSTAQLLVTVDGNVSAPIVVNLAEAAPGIFGGGVLNQDSSLNQPDNPAMAGTVLQIFTTGLLPPEGGRVEAKVHDVIVSDLDYAGAAPGIAGVQQVNVRIPDYLPSMTTDLLVCNVNAQRVCSAPVRLHLRQQQ
ncbi:MAG TPA: hypothetical protein VFL57_16490 [Bryobacteraceae bacterium]|nr:hypothetical protein [Bryobacteraceae bacterium]